MMGALCANTGGSAHRRGNAHRGASPTQEQRLWVPAPGCQPRARAPGNVPNGPRRSVGTRMASMTRVLGGARERLPVAAAPTRLGAGESAVYSPAARQVRRCPWEPATGRHRSPPPPPGHGPGCLIWGVWGGDMPALGQFTFTPEAKSTPRGGFPRGPAAQAGRRDPPRPGPHPRMCGRRPCWSQGRARVGALLLWLPLPPHPVKLRAARGLGAGGGGWGDGRLSVYK